jgi:phosphonopyruvate decarboxylase
MIDGRLLAEGLRARDFAFFSGVPCSHFGDTLDHLGPSYHATANEGSALALAAGAYLAGSRSAILIQNSGLGNIINPLTSLVVPYRIPVLLLVTLRGWPDPDDDEAQHAVMGSATQPMLDACGVPHVLLDPDGANLEAALAEAEHHLRAGGPAAVLVPRGAIARRAHSDTVTSGMTTRDAILALIPRLSGNVIVTTTGHISREVHAAADSPLCFYVQGAMGHAVAIGKGIALARPDLRVAVLDGDGAAMMHLGNLASVPGSLGNLVHVVIDNNAYASTGGQPTLSHVVDWAALGSALGYVATQSCRDVESVAAAVEAATHALGPQLVVAHVELGDGQVPGRASSAISVAEIATRLCRSIGGLAP